MPTQNVVQPDITEVFRVFRFKKYDGTYEKAISGCKEPYVYQNSEGIFDTHKIPDAQNM